MAPRDRRLLPFPLAMIVGVIGIGIAARIVRLPQGNYDMGGMWTIALVSAAATLAALLVFGALFWRKGWT